MADWDFDPEAMTAEELTTDLRAWLRARPESPKVQAGALAYELTALMAFHAQSRAQALALIEQWRHVMLEQIDAFGVGVEHP